ncbi:MAG TPA: FAD/NAD(P)-binding protein [Microbacterium sp.]|nr:FAD/NAD(P)-binding protein [Microbacterium sp.]
MAAGAVRIAVVGGSVRGTLLVERLIARAAAQSGARPLHITVFDPYAPGSGRIWRDGQPQTLIMNTVAAQSTVFPDASITTDGPITTGPNLAEWCRMVAGEPTSLPAEVAAEAAATEDWSSPSRLLYGHYLRWAFARIIAAAPAHVRVRVVAERVDSLSPDGSGWTLATRAGGFPADAVLLAVGWLDREDAVAHTRIVAAGNPIDQDLAGIAPGSTVVVRGVGMGFFDVVSMLTEGRGGVFSQDLAHYAPSGREPLLIAGSRRGIPYRAKPAFAAPPFFPAQRILRAALPRLIARRPVDFARDVLPLIERDALHDHCAALARVRPAAVRDAAGLLAGLIEGAAPPEELVRAHVENPDDRLSLDHAANPFTAHTGAADADAVVAAIVRADAAEAALGMHSPMKLGLHSYAAARGALIELVGFGGLDPASFSDYRRFLSIAASFGSGPPLRRSRQLLALHEAGIVRFTGPGITVDVADGGVEVRAPGLAETVRADRLIEAWLPPPTVTRTADPLLRALLGAGLARPWRHADGTESDALEIRPEDGALIGAHGGAVPGLYSVGVPHEDVRVFTIIAPVPGTDSSVLRECDAAARSALAHAAHATTGDDS